MLEEHSQICTHQQPRTYNKEARQECSRQFLFHLFPEVFFMVTSMAW